MGFKDLFAKLTGKHAQAPVCEPPKPEPVPAQEPEPVQKPAPSKEPTPGAFTAAGKQYARWNQLTHRETEQDAVCLDVYGRRVVRIHERFPCMDSYDRLYEDRCFRWFYIWNDGAWTQIAAVDGKLEVEVTEGLSLEQIKNRAREMSGGGGYCMICNFDPAIAAIMEEIEGNASVKGTP